MNNVVELNHVVIGDETQFSVLVLHGILGSCQNWRFFCNKLRRLRPSLRFVLADLRNHGRSPHIDGDNGLFECAQDLYQLQHKFGAFDAIVGHSFGGKVALQCANGVFDDRLKEVWVLDSNPAKEGTESRDFSEVAQVIAMLQKVKLPIANRRALVTTLMNMGASDSIAKWMTTNVIKGNGGYVWKFNLNAITNMIEDYFCQDLWHVFDQSNRNYHIVRAMRSDRWSKSNVSRMESLTSGYHQIDAGHWIHVDNPEGLMQLLAGNLLRKLPS